MLRGFRKSFGPVDLHYNNNQIIGSWFLCAIVDSGYTLVNCHAIETKQSSNNLISLIVSETTVTLDCKKVEKEIKQHFISCQ